MRALFLAPLLNGKAALSLPYVLLGQAKSGKTLWGVALATDTEEAINTENDAPTSLLLARYEEVPGTLVRWVPSPEPLSAEERQGLLLLATQWGLRSLITREDFSSVDVLDFVLYILFHQQPETVRQNYTPKSVLSLIQDAGESSSELFVVRLVYVPCGMVSDELWPGECEYPFLGLWYPGWYDRYVMSRVNVHPYWEEDFIYGDLAPEGAVDSDPDKPERVANAWGKLKQAPLHVEPLSNVAEAHLWYVDRCRILCGKEVLGLRFGPGGLGKG